MTLKAWNPVYIIDDIAESSRMRWCCGIFWLLAFLILIPVLIAMSLERVGSTEVALAYDTINCKLSSRVLSEGLHQKPTFGRMIKWPSTYQTIGFSNMSCNTNDGVSIDVSVSFQYSVEVQQIHNLTLTYKSFSDYDRIIELTSTSALLTACSRFTAREFQTKRSEVTAAMNDVTKQYIEPLFANVIEVQLVNVVRPTSYESAVQSKEAALANITLAQNQRQQQVTTANTNLLVASKNANITLETANITAAVTLAQAQAQASAIALKFDTYARVYRTIKEQQNLTVEGILAYIGTRLISGLNSINLQLESPAQASWKTSLSSD